MRYLLEGGSVKSLLEGGKDVAVNCEFVCLKKKLSMLHVLFLLADTVILHKRKLLLDFSVFTRFGHFVAARFVTSVWKRFVMVVVIAVQPQGARLVSLSTYPLGMNLVYLFLPHF